MGTGVLGSGPASAHAALTGSDPAEGSTLSAAPSTVSLTFNENVGSTAQVAVTAPDGNPVEVTDIEAVDRQVTASVDDADQRGTYTLSFRVVSADGHPVTGSIAYDLTVGRTVDQVDVAEDRSFLQRHGSHVFWGVLAAAVAIALLLAPLRKRHDSDTA